MAPAATQKSARPIGLHECPALAAVVRIPESAQEMHFWRAAYAPSGVDRPTSFVHNQTAGYPGNSLLACIVWENGLESFFWRHTYNARGSRKQGEEVKVLMVEITTSAQLTCNDTLPGCVRAHDLCDSSPPLGATLV